MSRMSSPIVLLALMLIPLTAVPARAQPYAGNIFRAENYLLQHLDRDVGLVYESDDPGKHWLTSELQDFHWRYDQTYWLYSDNLFAYLALKRDYPEVADSIRARIEAYGQPPALLFEVVTGEHIPLPLRNPHDYIVAENDGHVVLIRRHNASSIAFGEYVDFWMYEALERALEGDLASAIFLVRQAERLWRGDGLWDWSFTIYDHMFSNQKLALLLLTARALRLSLEHEDEMEAHLWSMQNDDGGIASLSDPSGKKAGSANAETTALTILIHDQTTLAKFPKAQFSSDSGSPSPVVLLVGVVVLVSLGFWVYRLHLKERLA